MENISIISAEKSLLLHLMKNPDKVSEAYSEITEKDFTCIEFGFIFKSIFELFTESIEITKITLLNIIEKNGTEAILEKTHDIIKRIYEPKTGFDTCIKLIKAESIKAQFLDSLYKAIDLVDSNKIDNIESFNLLNIF